MNFSQLKKVFSDQGCSRIYVKHLSPNDNSKNQVYLGGSYEALNIFPIAKVEAVSAGDWTRERFKVKLDFAWLDEIGNKFIAPQAQLILYPKYPEVRLSGFLQYCLSAPSHIMATRDPNRLLFLGVTSEGLVVGYAIDGASELANEYIQVGQFEQEGIFFIIPLVSKGDGKSELIEELRRIHNKGWILSKRLDKFGQPVNCNAPNCGGYTLEAELGITPNGYSEPDFLGWEIKQFGVDNFERISSKAITLMTPEPTGGLYKENGIEDFIRSYGYPDQNNVPDRLNFGGVHISGKKHQRTKLTLMLDGFDIDTKTIRNTNGKILLIDDAGRDTASWSFSSMLIHWNKKHNKACYIPSLSNEKPQRQYYYGNSVILGEGTDFQLFLSQMANGTIYYDPGIKLENASSKPKIKRRSQFRIKSGNLKTLYHKSEVLKIDTNSKST